MKVAVTTCYKGDIETRETAYFAYLAKLGWFELLLSVQANFSAALSVTMDKLNTFVSSICITYNFISN